MYTEKTFNLPELSGLSKQQIDAHLGLYSGYVKNTNKLLATLEAMDPNDDHQAYAKMEVRRRLGFEFNGMRLHEYYFEQFENEAENDNGLKAAIESQYGSFDAWKEDFVATGKMRGIGWILLVQDETTEMFHNVWVNDHEAGHLGGQKILLAMDVWEHAFMVDYLPSERGTYIGHFFDNLNWSVVESRYNA